MPRPSFPGVLLAFVVVALIACLPGRQAPHVSPGHTLELGGTPSPVPSNEAFRVAFAAPQGETTDPGEVTLVFNRPMRPLEAAADGASPGAPALAPDAETPAPARLVVRGTDAVPRGRWRWMGTSALVFSPESRLPDATEYVLTVPAGTRSLSGEALPFPFESTFSTPRPHAERLDLDPDRATDQLEPGETFALRFNQPVDPHELERAGTLTVGQGTQARRIPFVASRPDAKNPRRVKVVPASPLPLASVVRLVLDDSLRGTDGPLPMKEGRTFDMATYGPLGVKQVHCWDSREGRCRPGVSLQVELTGRVTFAELRSHLRITPPVDVAWSKTRSDDTKEDSFSVPALLRAGESYRVSLAAGMRDEHGQTLVHGVDVPLVIDDLAPSVTLGLDGTVLEAASIHGRSVPVTSVNTAAYALAMGAIDPRQVAELVAARSDMEEGPRRQLARVSAWPGVRVERVIPGAGRNVSTARRVAIEPLLAATGGRGAFVLATERELRVANVTDLAITAKMSRFGSLVWVTRLSNGEPVSGATVSIGDRAGARFETRSDADGLAAIPADRYAPADDQGRIDDGRLVFARLGDDWTWRRVEDTAQGGGDGPWIDASGGLEPLGTIFTDRGVYRPGETAELEAIFRLPRPTGTVTPAGRIVTLRATDAQGDSLFEGKATLDDFGVTAMHLPLPPTAHLGEARIEATLDDERGASVSATVQLAAYKASEFKVAVEAGASSWMHGERATFDVHGEYLFGAPMAGAKVHWSLTRARSWFTPPGAEGFVVDDEAYERDLEDRAPRAAHVESADAVLDAQGAFAAHVPLALEGQHGTEIVTLEAEVEDLSRQRVAARASGRVHPASFYVALRRPGEWFLAKGIPVRAEVAAVEPGGKHRPGVAVHVELVRRTWSSVLESTGESAGHWNARPVDATVASCDVVSTAASTFCALPAPQPGYYLVRAHARDAQAHDVVASYELYAIGDGGDAGWATSDASEVKLVPDKKAYQVGDVARVLVKSPYREADALVTVERSGILRQERVHLVGATPTLRVPITEDLRPNAFVSVHLVRGRSRAAAAGGADVGAPAYKSGYASLNIDPESRRLTVELMPARKDLRPGDTVEADVGVTDPAGKPAAAELTLWAVDEGVLMLTGYATPDPLPTFTAPRSLAVFTLESRADLARIFRASFGQLGVDKGDEGGGGGAAMRADFRATAWFQPAVKTGADGRAHVRFTLPDNLTTFRVMAVAAGRDDRFGHGETQVTTSRPLMVRPALPRFLRAGDAMDAGVVVSTKGMPDTQVELTASAQGATVGGDAKRRVLVKSGESVEVRWPIVAPRAGTAKITFRARGGGESDAVELSRRVDVPTTLETVALEGETRAASAERLGDLGALRDDVGGLDVRLSSTALLGVGDGMDQLLEYPYGCTEQLTSRLVPLVAARDLAVALGIAVPKDPDALADVAVAKILANQRSEGGFGWWPDSRASDAWVTAYALWGLDAAKKEGRPIPQAAIDHAVQWLRGRLSEGGASPVDRAGEALVVDVLATIGKLDPGFTDRLFEHRAEMPLFARALLAHAIAVGKMDRAQGQELLRDLEQHLRITPQSATVVDLLGDDYAPLLDSQPRTTAMVLRALVALDPRNALASRLARGLLGERRNGQWASTDEAAWSLLALDDYRRACEEGAPAFDARVWVSGQLALAGSFGGTGPALPARSAGAPPAGGGLQRDVTVPMATVLGQRDATLVFQVDGSGTLFYEARLRYARKEPPREGMDRGFFVRKLVRSVTSDGLREALTTLPAQTQERVRVGDLVLVDLVLVTATPREQVVLDDPMAAGLEPVDASLATTAASLDVTESSEDADDGEPTDDDATASGRGWGSAFFHREMRDDRVLTFVEHLPAGMYHYRYLARATTVGKFAVPPTRAECMYDPAVFGRTGASELEVTSP